MGEICEKFHCSWQNCAFVHTWNLLSEKPSGNFFQPRQLLKVSKIRETKNQKITRLFLQVKTVFQVGIFYSPCSIALIMNFISRVGVNSSASFHLSIVLKSLSFSTKSRFRKWYTPGFGASQEQACASDLEFWSCEIAALDLKMSTDFSSGYHAEKAVP